MKTRDIMMATDRAAAVKADGRQADQVRRPMGPTRAAPGLPGGRYKDVDGTMLLKTNNGMFIRAIKLGPNRWLNVVIRDGMVVLEAILGHKEQGEMCRRIDILLADEAA